MIRSVTLILIGVAILVCSASALADDAVVYAFLPLENQTLAGVSDWVGWGVTIKLKHYLSLAEEATFIPQDRIERIAYLRRVPLDDLEEPRRARRLLESADLDCIVWGRYQIYGKTARCQISLYQNGHSGIESFQVSGKIYYFDQLTQHIFSEFYRMRGHTVPPHLRQTWADEPPLGEEYQYLVYAVRPGWRDAERTESLEKYLEKQPRDLFASLLLADHLHNTVPSEADKAYMQILEWAPDCGLAHSNLAFLLAEQNRRKEAREHYKAALRCKDRYPETYLNYGNLLRRESLFNEAIRVYNEGIQQFPDAAWVHFNLALLYKDRSLLVEASATYREAYRLDKTLRPDFFENGFYWDSQWISFPED